MANGTVSALKAKLAKVGPAGGTNLAEGFQSGLDMLAPHAAVVAKAKPKTPKGKKRAPSAEGAEAAAEAADTSAEAGAATSAVASVVVSRVLFLTDMQSGQADEDAVLALAAAAATGGARAALPPVFSSLIGIGVDLSVGAVQAISTTTGGEGKPLCMFS